MRNVHDSFQLLPIYSFPYAARGDARILILGTMPSVASLSAGHYYAHPRNAFWPIMQALLNPYAGQDGAIGAGSIPGDIDWVARYELLLSHRIALWDVARTCTRQASADSAMHGVEPNDIPRVLGACPDIQAICFNGAKAASLFRTLVQPRLNDTQRAIRQVTMPSTSPARAIPFDIKLAAWRCIVAFLET